MTSPLVVRMTGKLLRVPRPFYDRDRERECDHDGLVPSDKPTSDVICLKCGAEWRDMGV